MAQWTTQIDTDLLRLQYEILGASFADIAKQAGISESFLREEYGSNWVRRFDALPDHVNQAAEFETSEEALTQFIEQQTNRLAAFEAAKDTILAIAKAKTEARMWDKIQEAINAVTVEDPRTLSALIALAGSFKRIVNKKGEITGLPTVIMRNLTGHEDSV